MKYSILFAKRKHSTTLGSRGMERAAEGVAEVGGIDPGGKTKRLRVATIAANQCLPSGVVGQGTKRIIANVEVGGVGAFVAT